MDSYGLLFRLGLEQIPPTRIRCEGFGYEEPYKALKVALHCGGACLSNGCTFMMANCSVVAPTGADYGANGGYFVIGQDFETYTSQNNSQLLQGVSMLGSDLYWSGNTGAMAAGAIFDFFLTL